MNESEFDQYANDYEKLLNAAIPPGMQENLYFAEYKIALLANRLKNNEPYRILDFGCGSGRSLPLLEKYFPESQIWGYDLSAESLKIASSFVTRSSLVSNWDAIKDVYFDLIFAANVFHHIPTSYRVQELIRCRKHLNNGGTMFIFEHNPYNPFTRRVFERCPYDKDAEMITLRSAIKNAEYSGFSSCSHGYTLFFPRPLAVFRKLEKLLHWLPLGAQYFVQMAV